MTNMMASLKKKIDFNFMTLSLHKLDVYEKKIGWLDKNTWKDIT